MGYGAHFVIDVGSPKNFGWAASITGVKSSGSDISALSGAMNAQLRNGNVSLGVEAPLTIPLRGIWSELTKARPEEIIDGSRPWSAGAGAAVTTLVIPTLYYLFNSLSEMRELKSVGEVCQTGTNIVQVWEAFVSGRAKGTSHANDAEIALATFFDREPMPMEDVGNCVNLAAVAAIRADKNANIASPVPIFRST